VLVNYFFLALFELYFLVWYHKSLIGGAYMELTWNRSDFAEQLKKLECLVEEEQDIKKRVYLEKVLDTTRKLYFETFKSFPRPKVTAKQRLSAILDSTFSYNRYYSLVSGFFKEVSEHIELIDDTKTSASEIIMELILNTELLCNKEIAELLYMGLVSDSNRFLFNNCSSSTFKCVSDILKEYELDLGSIYNKLYLRPMSEVRLQGYISLNMKVTENKLGYIVVPNDVIVEFEVDSASAGNMVNEFNFIKEVLVWATITEDIKNNQYRISIRSRGPEINKVAENFNGGGHKFASGVRTRNKEDIPALLDALEEVCRKYKAEINDVE
jgi:hypothetical protein